ncbi:MAG: hypothetical protein IPG64_27980 [Haliea sp.]|nr:hypothetical protein [Haliea sp.]
MQAIARLHDHGRDPLTQDNVRRLIEDVRGTGAPITDRSAEVIPGQPLVLRADHAGAFALGSGALPGGADGGMNVGVDNVIWWDCQANDKVHRWPWSRSETRGTGAGRRTVAIRGRATGVAGQGLATSGAARARALYLHPAR